MRTGQRAATHAALAFAALLSCAPAALRAQTAVFVVAQEFPAALPLPFLNELT